MPNTTPRLLTAAIAQTFPSNINDGFARPLLGWSAFGAEHLEGVGGSCMTCNVWIGDPTQLLAFIEDLAVHYEHLKSEMDVDADEDGVSLGYWEKDGLAMVGEFCTGDAFFEQKTQDLYTRMYSLHLVLGDGNDNDAGVLLNNDGVSEELLDVPTRLTLANFMNDATLYVLEHDDMLTDFTQEDKATLRGILERNPG